MRKSLFVVLMWTLLFLPVIAQADDTIPPGTETITPENAASLKQLLILAAHTTPVTGARFSPDGALLVTTSDAPNYKLWDTHATESDGILPRETVSTGVMLSSFSFNTEGTLLAAGGADGNVGVWDVSGEKAQPAGLFEGHTDAVVGAVFSPRGFVLYTASLDTRAWYWETASGKVTGALAHSSPVLSLSLNPDGNILVSGTEDGVIRLWNIEERVTRVTRFQNAAIVATTFSPDGALLAVANQQGQITLYAAASGEALATMDAYEGPVVDLMFSPDGALLASAAAPSDDFDGTSGDGIKIWDLSTPGQPSEIASVPGAGAVTFSPDGTLLVAGSPDGTLVFWGVAPATPTPTNTPTDTPTATDTPTNTPTDTPTATHTATSTPTDIPTDTPTATASPTDKPTATNTSRPTRTPRPRPTSTPST